LAELDAFKRLMGDRTGREVMVWTGGGHYFRGNLRGIDAGGFLVIEEVSCTLAGERQERELVLVNLDAVDAVSPA
jgi:small nuclear ribonucleoprotein (snRNP)-like protein